MVFYTDTTFRSRTLHGIFSSIQMREAERGYAASLQEMWWETWHLLERYDTCNIWIVCEKSFCIHRILDILNMWYWWIQSKTMIELLFNLTNIFFFKSIKLSQSNEKIFNRSIYIIKSLKFKENNHFLIRITLHEF